LFEGRKATLIGSVTFVRVRCCARSTICVRVSEIRSVVEVAFEGVVGKRVQIFIEIA